MTAKLEMLSETSEAPGEQSRVDPAPGWAAWITIIVALGGVLLLWVWSEGSEGRAIRALPPGERQALYTRTVQNLGSVCSLPDDDMRDFCGDQARLALEFPECDHACQELAKRQFARVRSHR